VFGHVRACSDNIPQNVLHVGRRNKGCPLQRRLSTGSTLFWQGQSTQAHPRLLISQEVSCVFKGGNQTTHQPLQTKWRDALDGESEREGEREREREREREGGREREEHQSNRLPMRLCTVSAAADR
jgi:hypothetical protein